MEDKKSEDKLYPNNGKLKPISTFPQEDKILPNGLGLIEGKKDILLTEGKVASFFFNKVNKIMTGKWINGEVGSPDLYIQNDLGDINGNRKFWVEAKSENDGLRPDQMRWFANHPEEITYVAVVNWKNQIEFFKVKIERMPNGIL